MMAEVEVARIVQRHEMNMGMGYIDTYNSGAYFNAGADFLQTLCHLAGKEVKSDVQLVIEVEDVVHFLLGNAEHMTLNYGIYIKKC